MDDLFKQNLLRLRSPSPPVTFAQALMGPNPWELVSTPAPRPVLVKEEFTEQAQVIESLERFAQEKIKHPDDSLPVEGGEIRMKKEPIWEGVPRHEDLTSLSDHLSMAPEIKNIILAGKKTGKIAILFVSETFRDWSEVQSELKDGFINELLCAFPVKTAELFERMVKAMKLTQEEVMIYPVEQMGQDLSAEVMQLSGYFRPELIVTLGAKASQQVLKNKDRLSLIHGQFFPRKIENIGTFSIVPLFHPSIIETNQNMKKTAWADMQKIMKHLKKLP
jgi:uracil-DNA glycosylase family 4